MSDSSKLPSSITISSTDVVSNSLDCAVKSSITSALTSEAVVSDSIVNSSDIICSSIAWASLASISTSKDSCSNSSLDSNSSFSFSKNSLFSFLSNCLSASSLISCSTLSKPNKFFLSLLPNGDGGLGARSSARTVTDV